MSVHLIWAQAHRRVIGAGGDIPWHVPGEQAIFKERTAGSTVVMGRATWDSLPRRPLPGRRNVVLTRDPGWTGDGAHVVHSPDLIGEVDFWVIGGAAVYQLFLPVAEHIVRTSIELDVEGDTFAPELGPDWKVTASTGWLTAPNGIRYVVEDLARV
ncbi:dihydrofolate reductase [Actinoplanes sp. SE50]|uniref:dihydrofolate reductase n=1 Tax=unclassified Actinoplanes TaxID=2626549 RepID=UPI00023EBC6E|nr:MULTISPECIES: dihydrofolate reductase [unclassified Actinoplanes]AEV87959.1 dihydrofolate reductase [Actinoplanes sp. SE50/110]ATO86363.1 dihydrofolate reductase [Actinoplanes sp. SE50]SLM03778.1 dihydrofolate reductase [Actinoplanes sp. SE50/110]